MPKQQTKGGGKTAGKSGSKKKGKTSNNTSGFKRPPSGAGITWGSTAPPKPEKTYVQKNFWFIVAGIVFFMLFCLWAFVDDKQTILRKNAEREAAKKRENQTQSQDLQRKEFTFEHSHLYNTTQFTEIMKKFQEDIEYDRIIVVAFDDSTREAEGSPTKVRLFRKYETIAKSMPRKSMFKRYEEDELPLIVAFDCGNPSDASAESLCKQIVGENIPNVVVFRPKQQPRALPNEYRSDNQIIQYLYNLMQPAVRYLEERSDCEDFVANDEMMNVLLFGDEKTGSFDKVADLLREFARFGKTRNPAVAEEFDTEMNSILVWKTFGQNPNRFGGNISDTNAVYNYVMNNYLPVFGEFNPSTSNRYMKRGLPIVWIAYDRNSEESKDVLEVAETMAHRYLGTLSFVQLDAKSYPNIANSFGIDVSKNLDNEKEDDDDDNENEDEEEDKKKASNDDEDENDTNRLPQVFIMNQMAQIREFINMEDIETSINKVCDEYLRQVRNARGEGLTELDTSEYEDDDETEEFEEDDEDEDEIQLDKEEYDEDEEEDNEQDTQSNSPGGPPKQDL